MTFASSQLFILKQCIAEDKFEYTKNAFFKISRHFYRVKVIFDVYAVFNYYKDLYVQSKGYLANFFPFLLKFSPNIVKKNLKHKAAYLLKVLLA